ncbi:MAG: hypothetical protein KGL44_03800 [Sphingomonadales bacterium]|nr:hypothetical protein [Sphingomonadales bacterium]
MADVLTFPLDPMSPQEAFLLAQSICESDPVLRTFAACEWECLNDDGKEWVTAIVREAVRRTRCAHG